MRVGQNTKFVRIILAILIIIFASIAIYNVVLIATENNFTNSEWNDWMNEVTQYNVDVKIPNSHAWQRHGDADVQAALRCISENGTEIVLSENDNRNLHLLCRDKQGNEYVVIIEKIKKAKDSFRNATSVLKTAWKLKDGATLGSYIQNEVITFSKSIVVRLRFAPGEIYFMPY